MRQKQLGSSGLSVSAIGLGCMGMSAFYGPRDDDESRRALARAIELGITFWDTADMYGAGENEKLIGGFLKGRRESVVIATKFGNVFDPRLGSGIKGTPDYVRYACDQSLMRLGIDTIDLYYQHRVDLNTPIEDTVGAMAELVAAGKVRYLGLSEAAPATIRRAYAVHPIAALQTEYSLWSRDPEGEILQTCRELGVGFVAYSPLGRGFLTGRFRSIEDFADDDWRREAPRFMGDNLRRNLSIVNDVEQIAAKSNCTPSQIALAWLMARGQDIIPIPGTKHVKYLEENAASADITLTPDEIQALDNTLPPVGERYAEQGLQRVDR